MTFIQDSKGFIWIGTQDGLVRWDGYRPKLFRHISGDTSSLPSNLINGLVSDGTGSLFVATSNGVVAHYDPATEHFSALPATRTGTGVYCAFVDDIDGSLWQGNANGLSHFTSGSSHWESIPLPGDTRVWSLIRTHDGAIWAGTEHGLFRKPSGTTTFEAAGGESPIVHANIRSLMETETNDLWFGTNDGRIGILMADGTIKLAEIPHPSSAILSLVNVSDTVVVAGTGGSGLVYFDSTTGKTTHAIRYDAMRASGLAEDFIYSLYKDRLGGLWIGHTRGADYIAASNGVVQSLLSSERNPQGLSGSHVTSMGLRADGKLLIGTENGGDLLSQENGRMSILHQQVLPSDALPAAQVYGIVTTTDGVTWIATAQGLYERRNGKLTQFKPLGDDPVRSLFAEDNTLWIGLYRQGLMKLDLTTRTLSNYQHDGLDPGSISDNFVLGILRDPEHGLWVGTQHGLNLFDGKSFHTFMNDPADAGSIPSDTAIDLQLDRHKRLWVGTHGGGVAVLEGDPLGVHRFRHIGRAEGLSNDNVGTILTDQKGNIWLSTDTGIAEIDPETFSVRTYGAADGVAITGNFIKSGVRLQDGTLLFGGLDGVTVIHPDRVEEKDTSSQVTPTSIRIDARPVSDSQPIILSASDHSLQVEFSALNYAAPEDEKYSYLLDGFDKDWIVTDADHRLAAYTNLPPGTYSLLIRSADRAGRWSKTPTRLIIKVLPAWHQTWWSKLAALGMIVAAVIGVIRSRTALLRHRQKELEGQVAERTAELASLLNNSGEGFLSFGPDLQVDRQYSKACESFLGEPPAHKDASILLFAENPRQASFFSATVPTALSAQDPAKRELILSLLPKEIDRRGRRLKLHYAILENDHMMVVLSDITTERRLAERIASEHRRLGLIVAAVTDSRDFFDALHSFNGLVEKNGISLAVDSPLEGLQEIYHQVHTLKGTFNQLSFEKTPVVLHELEEDLDFLRKSGKAYTIADIEDLITSSKLKNALEQDLAIVRKALGNDFLTKGGQVTMSLDQANEIKKLARGWRDGVPLDLNEPSVRKLLDELEKVGSISLKDELANYDHVIAQVALRLGKEVGPLVVTGSDEIWVDPETFGPFLHSLIHVFRNCVTHGIEAPEQRLEKGKTEFGQITCEIDLKEGVLHLLIADDGAGIDLAWLRTTLVQLGICSATEVETMPDEIVASYIFRDYVSTGYEVSQWAGRGVGLAAVKREVEALGGEVSVQTSAGFGTRILFKLRLVH